MAGALVAAGCDDPGDGAAEDASRTQDAAVDARVPPVTDGGPDRRDGERPVDLGLPDALAPSPDASGAVDQGRPDSALPVTDAAPPPPRDASSPDAGAPPDRDASSPDAAAPPDRDASAPAEDAGPPPSPDGAPPDAGVERCADGERRGCVDAPRCAGGAQVCAGGEWQPCRGPDELCNGLDDDCDGAVDEALEPLPTACGLGPCAAVGRASCVDGVLVDDCAPAASPEAETCDGVDNDCNGEVDDQLGATRCGAGACEHDQLNCVDGAAVVCEPLLGATDEVCDGEDDDCDGATDEGLPVTPYFPDVDGDGQGASGGSSCASLLADGVTDDGYYTIQPDARGGPTLRVFCDMTRDGGGWTRVFRHDIAAGYFASDAAAARSNVDAPESGLYSILDQLESFRSSNGRFVLRLDWPDEAIPGRNIWSQSSNPTTAPVVGYEAIDVEYTSQFWGGLELSDRPETFLDGSVGHPYWFYSVGSQVGWNDPPGIPAHTPQASGLSLWVRPDDALAGGAPMDACGPTEGFAPVGGDCDDGDAQVQVGAVERCNGLDDDCDGERDEGCPFGDLVLRTWPQPLHFYARAVATERCDFVVEGDSVGAASEVRVTVTRDGEPFAESVAQGAAFSVPVTLDAGLTLYDVSIAWGDGGGFWRPVATVEDVVCGDVFLIDGQSNAMATDYHAEGLGDLERNTFVRSFGSAVNGGGVVDDRDFNVAVANAAYTRGAIGQWGLTLANAIKDAEQVPVLVLNGAVGGTRVDQHQRNDANPEDPATIYGRLLWRVRRAGVADGVRAIFWHQGESDGAQPYAAHLALWTAMYDDWLQDYPNVQGVFPFQVRAGCGGPTWNRNIHRELPGLLERVLGNMSTTGVAGHDGCHFFHATYVEWGQRMARVALRELYGAAPEGNIDAPDPQSARWLSPTELELDYGATGGGLLLQPGALASFSLSDGARLVGARVEGRTLVLTTAAPSAAAWVSFVDAAGDVPWLVNDLGVGGFAFYQFPISP